MKRWVQWAKIGIGKWVEETGGVRKGQVPDLHMSLHLKAGGMRLCGNYSPVRRLHRTTPPKHARPERKRRRVDGSGTEVVTSSVMVKE